jgi:hypothetical protein
MKPSIQTPAVRRSRVKQFSNATIRNGAQIASSSFPRDRAIRKLKSPVIQGVAARRITAITASASQETRRPIETTKRREVALSLKPPSIAEQSAQRVRLDLQTNSAKRQGRL